MILQCKECGKSFKTSHADRKSCSRECMALAYRKQLRGAANPNFNHAGKRTCQYCGGPYKSYDRRRKYCSRKCYIGISIKDLAAYKIRISRKPRPARLIFMCPACRTQFSTNHSKSRTYCCQKCSWNGRRIKAICVCGKNIIRQKCLLPEKGRLFCSRECYRMTRTGSSNANWKGGITSKNKRFRASDAYSAWRKAVFARDGFKCRNCGQVGNVLHAHHVHSFSKYPSLRLEVSNGLTLCASCHKKTDSYLRKGEHSRIQSRHQFEFQTNLEAAGGKYLLVRSLQEVIKGLES